MIVFTATLKAKPGKENELEEALIHMLEQVQHEEGTLDYKLYRVKDDSRAFTVYEKYKDQAALDHHDSTPHMRELIAKFPALLDEEIEVHFYDEVASVSR
jgi:quinol monooxygenase YgiN